MADKELVKYVKEHIELDFSPDSIKLELLKHGNSAADIDEAIAEASSNRKKEGPHLVTKIVVFATIIAAVVIVLFFVFAKMKAPAEAETAPAVPEAPVVPPVEAPKEEAPPAEEPVPQEEIPPAEDIPPPEKEPVQEVPPAKTGREVPEYNISRMSFNLTQRLEVIKDVSFQNADAAIAMCADYNRISERDMCFATIARSIPDFNLCGRIVEIILRDQCYVSFAVTGTDTCDKINNTDVKESCNKLIELNLSVNTLS